MLESATRPLCFRSLLQKELERRQGKNPSYSLRSFARDIGLSPSRLSEIVNARQRLSMKSAQEVSQRLGLCQRDQQLFCLSAAYELTKDADQKQQILAEMSALQRKALLAEDALRVMSEWQYAAILAYRSIDPELADPKLIAQVFDLPVNVITNSLKHLNRLGLLSPKAGANKTHDYESSFDTPSAAIRRCHKAYIKKAFDAVDEQDMVERDLETIVMAFDSCRSQEAMAAIRSFVTDFQRQFGNGAQPDQIYCLSTQFFKLSTGSDAGAVVACDSKVDGLRTPSVSPD